MKNDERLPFPCLAEKQWISFGPCLFTAVVVSLLVIGMAIGMILDRMGP